MQKLKNKLYLGISLLAVGCIDAHTNDVEVKPQDVAESTMQPEADEIPEGRLYVQSVMDACNAKVSPAKREILAEQIRLVGEAFFPKNEERKWFYFLICIESRFNNESRSPVGATGLTQVMPKYAPEFAKACGIGEIDPKDLADSQVNLIVGACRFKELMLHYKGDPALALAAYNSGLDSPTVRKTASLDVRTGHPETIGYLAAAFVLNQRMTRAGQNDTVVQTAQLH
jgi:hypothetical protein